MKKIISLLLFIILFTPSIINASECNRSKIEEYSKSLNNVKIDLEYADDILDMNGDKLENYFKLNFSNIGGSYYIVLDSDMEKTTYNSFNTIYTQGGVYNVNIYHYDCDNVIKTYQIFIPTYKNYCYDNKCNDVWFDGTYENNPNAQNVVKSADLGIWKLVILIIGLLIIACIIYIFNIKKGRKKII